MSPKHQRVETGKDEICFHNMHYKNHEEERKKYHHHRLLINAWQPITKSFLHKYHVSFVQNNSVSWNALFGFNFDWRMLSRSPTSSACFSTCIEDKSESVVVTVESLTSSSISLVCEADRQKRTRPRTKGVAGKPTVTTETPRFNISRLKALINEIDNAFHQREESGRLTQSSRDCTTMLARRVNEDDHRRWNPSWRAVVESIGYSTRVDWFVVVLLEQEQCWCT